MDSFTQRFHLSTSHRSHFYTRPVRCIQNTFFPNDLTAYSLDTENALKSGQYRRGCQRLTKEKRAKATMNIHKKANQNECMSTIKGAFEVCSADTLG